MDLRSILQLLIVQASRVIAFLSHHLQMTSKRKENWLQ